MNIQHLNIVQQIIIIVIMQLFTLKEWIISMGIHKKIEDSLSEIAVNFIYGKKDPSLQWRNFAEYFGFKEKPNNPSHDTPEFLFFLVGME